MNDAARLELFDPTNRRGRETRPRDRPDARWIKFKTIQNCPKCNFPLDGYCTRHGNETRGYACTYCDFHAYEPIKLKDGIWPRCLACSKPFHPGGDESKPRQYCPICRETGVIESDDAPSDSMD